MRLTADLITNSLIYLNPLKEREINLRGHKIPAIENLGVAGPLDCIDFTDNDIQTLGNFPLSPRITSLLLSHNRISAIQPTLPNAIPKLTNLTLMSNLLSELSDLDVLGQFARLTHLVLVDNPVTKKENYRYWVIWRCPTVRFLDFVKVKQAERERAKELFGAKEDAPTELASQIMGLKSKTLNVAGATGPSGNAATAQPSKMSRLKLTEKEKLKLKDMIRKADSLEEIMRLEKALAEGKVPPGVILEGDDDDAMEE
ncbi:leucine-rich repeat-domain-containing protein [Apodospora peruviana]|uniref:U2 small nuclear ribonucleoprotein A' n=1 Tax=Apodospora peruviana TaxID=516989 RepID=A0AAE0I6T2_9PEZI|nr:leucine-rich repeat-domain-containing protein [Apodospora peruviana]